MHSKHTMRSCGMGFSFRGPIIEFGSVAARFRAFAPPSVKHTPLTTRLRYLSLVGNVGSIAAGEEW